MPNPTPATRHPSPVLQTTPPDRHVVLFDGHCNFCIAQSRNLLALARPNAIEMRDFQLPDVLTRFPGLTHEQCMQAMHLVTPQGNVYRGFEAAVRAVATRPIIGPLAYAYYVPGIRQLCDIAYRWIAARRYRLMGKRVAAGECAHGTCALHFPNSQRQSIRSNEERHHG